MKRFFFDRAQTVVCLVALLSVVALATAAGADEKPSLKDIVFAKPDGHKLKLDIFMPAKSKTKPPLVVFIHGGGWRNGSYKRCLTPWLTQHGFAVASVGYRLTHQAKFPAQVHDCKAAIRWLRANASKYGYDTQRIGVAGTSAGGHLALMMGVTAGDKTLEGDVGGNTDESSQVHAVVDYYGPSDFAMRARNQPVKTEPKDSPVRLLLGASARENVELAKQASPAYYVTSSAPPLLIIHGSNDKTVRPAQSQRMESAYQAKKRDVTLHVVPKAGHGGSAFFTNDLQQKVAAFFQNHLAAKE